MNYNYLKGRLDTDALLEALGIDIGFKQSAHQYMCHCPDLYGYHANGDSSPSFGYNEEKLAYNCFVCGGGNIVELVWMMLPEQKPASNSPADKGEATEATIKWLEQFADFNDTTRVAAKLQSLLKSEDEEDELPEYPEDNLFQYRKIHPYLYERGLTKDIIVEMQVGFDGEHLGITIPHFFMGKLVGMQRRHLMEEPKGVYHCPRCELDEKKKVPKYKNTAKFPKQNTLYGYDRMKQKLREEEAGSVIVVESPMTALKLMSMGYNRVVATFGQWSREQGMLLLAVPKVYFWPDNDVAGYENAVRCIETLGKLTTVKIVPVVDKPKGDAADLENHLEIAEYLAHSYPATVFSSLVKDKKLPTLESVLANSNT